MKYTFFLIILLANIPGCKHQTPEESKLLLQIISAHFSDRPTLIDLKEILYYEDWAKGKYSVVKRNNQMDSIPPPRPPDTVFYGDHSFAVLINHQILSKADVRVMKKKLIEGLKTNQLAGYDHQLNRLKKRHELYPQSDTIYTFPNFVSHYQFSQPLFNEDKTRVLVRIEFKTAGSSQGYNYIFERRQDWWEQRYRKLVWIE